MPKRDLHATLLRSLSPSQRARVLSGLSEAQCAELLKDWTFWARDEQVEPAGDWNVWAYVAGRGAGKTRTGAEWVREQVKRGCRRIALIAPTAADARKVMIEGESGLLSVCWDQDKTDAGDPMGFPDYQPSLRQLMWENGAQATTYSAEEPERLRGPSHDAGWCDELAAWRYLKETWDMYSFGLRSGDHPRTMVTTTPKGRKILKEIMADPATVVSRGSTYANAANLAKPFLEAIRRKYEGTRLGRQELYAEMLEEAEGALWTRAMIEAAYHGGSLPEMKRVVVAIDPAVTKNESSDETGIVAKGLGYDDKGYVLEDGSGRYSPREWAQKAVSLYEKWGADRVVAEVNNGGDMVEAVLRQVAPNVSYRAVHASKGKRTRAEPVSALYEQQRVRHVGGFPDLEDQMTSWEPLSGLASPDRVDALVWAATDLMVKPQRPELVIA